MTPSAPLSSPPAAKDRLRARMPVDAYPTQPPGVDEDDDLVVIYGAGEYFAGTAD